MTDFDKMMAEGAAAVIKETCKELFGSAITFGKRQIGKLGVEFETAFTKYLTRASRLHGKVKTLLNPMTPVSLDSAYVAVEVRRGGDRSDTRLTEAQFAGREPHSNRVAAF